MDSSWITSLDFPMPYDIPMALIGRILGANVFVMFFPIRCAAWYIRT